MTAHDNEQLPPASTSRRLAALGESATEPLHCAGCRGTDYLARPCRGREIDAAFIVTARNLWPALVDLVAAAERTTHTDAEACLDLAPEPCCCGIDPLRAALAELEKALG
jgi:hypothetical protein